MVLHIYSSFSDERKILEKVKFFKEKMILFQCLNDSNIETKPLFPWRILLFLRSFFHLKIIDKSRKRTVVEELDSRSLDTHIGENNQVETFEAPRIHPENVDEIKTSIRKEIMSDLAKILAENQKEMLN